MKGAGGGGKGRTRKPTGVANDGQSRGAANDGQPRGVATNGRSRRVAADARPRGVASDARMRGADADDRPRGFEAARMRQLWNDIDAAKRKAGLGRKPEPAPAPGWDVGGVLGRAVSLIGDAAAWVTANAPTALALLATGADLLRSVPVVGRLVELMPPVEPPKPAPPPLPRSIPPTHGNGTAHAARDPDEISDPEGGWIH
jgi:hypothetical protein